MKKIVFSVLAVAMCIAMMSSAFAYFTDVETSTGNTMQAGTLDMQIGDNNDGYTDTDITASFASPANWAPGDTFTTDPVYLQNVGTIAINRVYARFSTLVQTDEANPDAEGTGSDNNIADHIILVSYSEKSSNADWHGASDETGPVDGFYTEAFDAAKANTYLNYWKTRGASSLNDTKGYITLADLVVASNFGSGDRITALLLFDATPSTFIAPLPAGAIAQVKFTFQFDSAATNVYQGDKASFRVDFIGSQRIAYPDDLLEDSVTETLEGLTD
jgi:predicted ribosomally synthesized peptide with SipW-like signal peptide